MSNLGNADSELVLDKDVAKEKYRLRGGEETELLSSGTKNTKPERRRGRGGSRTRRLISLKIRGDKCKTTLLNTLIEIEQTGFKKEQESKKHIIIMIRTQTEFLI